MARTHKQKKKSKKKRGHPEDEIDTSIPRSFVIGQDCPASVMQLVKDMRMVMSPNTALKLKVRKKNVLKDFVHLAGPFGVSHLLVFRHTKVGTNLRIARLPRGPTLMFRVKSYSHIKDVARSQPNPKSPGAQYLTAPLLVLNNISADKVETRLTAKVFQSLFPSIDVSTVDLALLKRIVLLHHDTETDEMCLRHYEIDVKPTGISKSVKQLLKSHVPDLSKYDDVSDFVLRGGDGYESDASDMGDGNKVVLAQNMKKAGNQESKRSAIRLVELGPRMHLELVKIEDGFCEGDVLYHRHVHKTDEEVASSKKKIEKAHKLKAQRKAEQERNVKRKRKEKEENKKRAMEGQKKKYTKHQNEVVSDDDDEEYFRQEVGEEPEKGLFTQRRGQQKRRKDHQTTGDVAADREGPTAKAPTNTSVDRKRKSKSDRSRSNPDKDSSKGKKKAPKGKSKERNVGDDESTKKRRRKDTSQ
eukprot:m.253632 g.253632  ORF g.253632 m.253632 type:complete len:471 (-) comp19587_c0_seq2:49-1461(-)